MVGTLDDNACNSVNVGNAVGSGSESIILETSTREQITEGDDSHTVQVYS